MSVSHVEEIIAALWAICAILAFGFGFTGWGWFFAIKAALDVYDAVKAGILEILAERRKQPLPQGGEVK